MELELELELPWLLAFTNIFRSDVLHLTFHVITWLPLFYLRKIRTIHVSQHEVAQN